MLKIRLQRIGKKKQAYFRVVVTEHTVKPQGKYHELLGSYDPHANAINVKKDRVEHWLSKGVQMSATVNNLLVGAKVLDSAKYAKVSVWRAKKKSSDQAKTATQ